MAGDLGATGAGMPLAMRGSLGQLDGEGGFALAGVRSRPWPTGGAARPHAAAVRISPDLA